ncbi:MAG: tRNA (guanosine(46)-N7)-methyltransferase TrmB [Ginsengibacter sp.]
MAQKKLKRFAEIKSFPNVLEYPENMCGQWAHFFGNSNPVILELACGKGEYAIGLAELYPAKNFIGVDIKGNRLWVGAKSALENNLKNVAFLRTQIEKLPEYFNRNEIEEIWITFPDPQLRVSKAKKRLTHPRFLELYKKVLIKGGKIHLKTDSPDLYYFTKVVTKLYSISLISDIPDVYNEKKIFSELAIKTHYERLDIAKSKSVFYLSFALPDILTDKEEELRAILRTENDEVDY